MFEYFAGERLRVVVTGVSGFIGSHLAMELRRQGHHVVGVDWKLPEAGCIDVGDSCDEFHQADLRAYRNCLRATEGAAHVFHLAADMGGMGFIASNNSACIVHNALIDLHVLEACRANAVGRLFYASSACAYPEHLQSTPDVSGLREGDAWPARPHDAYGLEKLFAEEAYRHYATDFGLEVRVARFHNVYGPGGTWTGGREKAPAALCRKVAASPGGSVEVWGDGKQTRSFVYVDDLVEGVLRLAACDDPRIRGAAVNLGTEDLVSIDDLARLAIEASGRTDVTIEHAPGPTGVRGRNSNNDLMRAVLGWEPRVTLRDGMGRLYDWIAEQVGGAEDPTTLGRSRVLQQTMRPLPEV